MLTLVVEGAHAPMMQHVAPAIVERVNAFFGYPAVERVAFRQGIVQAAESEGRGAAPPSLRPAAIPAELGEFAARDRRSGAARLSGIACARASRDGEGAPVVTTIPVVGKIGGERKK